MGSIYTAFPRFTRPDVWGCAHACNGNGLSRLPDRDSSQAPRREPSQTLVPLCVCYSVRHVSLRGMLGVRSVCHVCLYAMSILMRVPMRCIVCLCMLDAYAMCVPCALSDTVPTHPNMQRCLAMPRARARAGALCRARSRRGARAHGQDGEDGCRQRAGGYITALPALVEPPPAARRSRW